MANGTYAFHCFFGVLLSGTAPNMCCQTSTTAVQHSTAVQQLPSISQERLAHVTRPFNKTRYSSNFQALWMRGDVMTLINMKFYIQKRQAAKTTKHDISQARVWMGPFTHVCNSAGLCFACSLYKALKFVA